MRPESDPPSGLAVCLLVRGDEPLLLRPWVLYHAGLVGLGNLHLIDLCALSPAAPDRLAVFESLGVNVHRFEAAPGRPPGEAEALDACLRSLAHVATCELAVLLEAGEFLVFNGPQGIGCRRSWIRDEIARLVATGGSARTEWGFDSQADRIDLFRCVPRHHRIFRIAGGAGSHGPGASDHDDGEHARTALQVLRVVPGATASALIEGEVLVRISEFERTLRSLDWAGELDGAGFAQGVPGLVGRWLLDVERAPFVPGAYLEANPDVEKAGVDALAHFVSHGCAESRALSAGETRQELFDRLDEQRRAQPDGTLGYRLLAFTALGLHKLGEAEAIVRDALARFGASPVLLLEYAWLGNYRSSAGEQLRRWENYRRVAPDSFHACFGLALASRYAGDGARARMLVNEGLARYPGQPELLDLAASLDDDEAMCGLAGDGSIAQLKGLLQRFESLGWSCEFGAVQRRFGVEPLGLLKFSNIHAAPLTRALRERFAGIDDPDQIAVLLADDGEFYVQVPKYEFMIHTYIIGDESEIPAMLTRMRAQLAFRRDKLLDDLDEGDKIFVHLCNPWTTDEELAGLASAFREATRAWLLCVRVGGDPNAHGAVVETAPRILTGWLSRWGIQPSAHNIDFACWIRLCAAVAAHLDRGAVTVAAREQVQ